MTRLARISGLGILLSAVSCHSPSAPTTKWTPAPPATSALRITGVIVDTARRPVADAVVRTVLPNGSDVAATTGLDGRFALSDPTPVEDRFQIQISKDGFLPATVTARNNTNSDLTISLTATDLLNLAGQYSMTVTAADSCSELPGAARKRTYDALMEVNPNYRAGIITTLSGGTLFPSYDEFFGNVASEAANFYISSWDAFNWWLEDQPIIERLDGNASVSFIGQASTTAPVTSNSSFSTTFDGTIAYCAAAKEPSSANFPLECAAAPITCRSSQHHVLFIRK